MRLRDEFCREWMTVGTLSRGAFWLRHCTSLPLMLWVAVAAGPTRLGWPAALATVVALASVWGRRLHDRGRSAWWLLLALLPVLGPLALCIECGLRGSSPAGARFQANGARADYLTVRSGTP